MQTPGKPLTGVILGAVAGIFVVIVIQQAGAWPLDRMLTFGVMGVMAAIGFVLTKGMRGPTVVKIISITIIIVFVGLAGVGVAEAGESGYIDGGCTAKAVSDIDSIESPAETSKSDPFDVDPQGMLSWTATSPNPILNHSWQIVVDVAGFGYVPARGGDPNDGESQLEVGERDLSEDAEAIEGILGTSNIGGIYEVSGYIDGDGGLCTGLGFVRIGDGGWFEGPIALGATAISVVVVVIIVMVGRGIAPLPSVSLGKDDVV
ncbi:MAG: hypothetical protein JSV07_05965 [Acidimicrobiia bacterium]|nr:MAG: hypothetical protein JSV07_05965 [Acidimicrobiia bacterium]